MTQPSHPLPTRPAPYAYDTREERHAAWMKHREEQRQRVAKGLTWEAFPFPDAARDPNRRGWLVLPVVKPLIERLSRMKLGYANATSATLREMAWVDSGHLYGERSIPRRLREEAKAKRLERHRVPRGGAFKGVRTINGTTTNRYPSEKERRERLWRERNAKRAQRREAKQRAKAAKLVRPPSPTVEKREAPRTALVPLVEREATFALPAGFLGLTPDAPPSDEQLAATRAKVEAWQAAARARPELWDEEGDPPER